MTVSLVLMPGMDGTGDLFAPFLSQLPSWIEPVVVSYPTTQPLDYVALKEVAKASLPTDKPFVLLGESFSGPIAILMASEGPVGLRGVILSASFVRAPRAWLKPLQRLLRLVPVRFAASVFGPRMLMGRFASLHLKMALLDAVGRVSSDVLRERIRAVLTVDVTSALETMRVPLLYLQPTEDRLVPKAAAADFARAASSGTIVELVGPHFLLQCAPIETARAVTDFIKRVQSGPNIRLQTDGPQW